MLSISDAKPAIKQRAWSQVLHSTVVQADDGETVLSLLVFIRMALLDISSRVEIISHVMVGMQTDATGKLG